MDATSLTLKNVRIYILLKFSEWMLSELRFPFTLIEAGMT